MASTIPEQSVFRRVGIGYAAQDLPENTHNLEILNVEWFGYSSGELDENTTKLEYTGVDASGKTQQVMVEASITIKAKWHPAQNNRMVPPHIVKGERVEIYQVADTDQYYWRSLGADEHLRKNDVMVVGLANKSKRDAEPLDHTNTYHMAVDTKNKLVSLRTNKSDGEPYAYDVQINSKEGSVVIADDVGNEISIQSKDAKLEFKNATGSSVLLFGDVFKVVAKQVQFDCQNFNVKTQAVSISAMNYTVTSSSYTHNGINVGATHKHGGVQGGNSTTGVPQ